MGFSKQGILFGHLGDLDDIFLFGIVTPDTDNLLLEDRFNFLLEDGFFLLLE